MDGPSRPSNTITKSSCYEPKNRTKHGALMKKENYQPTQATNLSNMSVKVSWDILMLNNSDLRNGLEFDCN